MSSYLPQRTDKVQLTTRSDHGFTCPSMSAELARYLHDHLRSLASARSCFCSSRVLALALLGGLLTPVTFVDIVAVAVVGLLTFELTRASRTADAPKQ